jgi:hypothetical protein
VEKNSGEQIQESTKTSITTFVATNVNIVGIGIIIKNRISII